MRTSSPAESLSIHLHPPSTAGTFKAVSAPALPSLFPLNYSELIFFYFHALLQVPRRGYNLFLRCCLVGLSLKALQLLPPLESPAILSSPKQSSYSGS